MCMNRTRKTQDYELYCYSSYYDTTWHAFSCKPYKFKITTQTVDSYEIIRSVISTGENADLCVIFNSFVKLTSCLTCIIVNQAAYSNALACPVLTSKLSITGTFTLNNTEKLLTQHIWKIQNNKTLEWFGKNRHYQQISRLNYYVRLAFSPSLSL